MREYIINVDKPLKNGLKPTDKIPMSGDYLIDCENVVPGPGGIIMAPKYTDTFNIGVDGCVFDTSAGVYVFYNNSMYMFDGSSLTQVLNNIPNSECSWTCADFGKFIVFSNGSCYILRDVVTGNFYIDSYNKIPSGKFICRVRGRLVIGNAGSGKENTVLWSDIGSLKFVSQSDLSTAAAHVAGSAVIPINSNILNIVPFEADLGISNKYGAIIYCSGGIVFMYAASVDRAEATFGFKVIDSIGIQNSRSVVDVNGTHYFVDKNNKLKILQRDLSIKILDYSNYISDNAVLSYDSINNYVIIGFDTYSLILTESGMGKVSAGVKYLKVLSKYGTISIVPYSDYRYYTFTTDNLSFGWPGHKTLESISIDGTVIGEYPSITSEFRVSKGSEFILSNLPVPINNSGNSYICITGEDFRITFLANNCQALSIHALLCGVKFTDKRVVRGAIGYGNQTAS